MTGEIIGMVTLSKRCNQLAPSMIDASYSDMGPSCSPARKITIELPAPHTAMNTIAILAQAGSDNQAGPVTPILASKVLMMPPCPAYMQNQRMLPATNGISDGKKNAVR